jgi:hypothetical protein
VKLAVWASVSPERMILDTGLLGPEGPHTAAARALKYSRAVGTSSYDDIGFRLFAAKPRRGLVPLSTLALMHHDRRIENVRRKDSAVQEIVEQQYLLRHRPVDLPMDAGGEPFPV